MVSSDGRYCVSYNGEIYNFVDLREQLQGLGHVFQSRSDTEVLLAAYMEWGSDCVQHLNGMFAFALYDGVRQSLMLARDRTGEKPLFFAHTSSGLQFASEIKGLLANPELPREIDPEGLNSYLGFGYVPGEGTVLRYIRKLRPAHALEFSLDDGHLRQWRYWSLPELEVPAQDSRVADEELLDELEVLLTDSVRRQLVADVPVAVLLSGGIDSSVITALAARSSPAVTTFTIRFPGHGRFDETQHARLVARHFGTRHIEAEAEPSTVDLLPLLARQFDDPVVDSSMIPTWLVARLARQHCTVALGGDGGDELFGGYEHYSRLLWLHRWLSWAPMGLRRSLGAAANATLPLGFRGRNWLQALSVDLERDVPSIATYFDATARRGLLKGTAIRPDAGRALCLASAHERSADLLQRATRLDFANYLPEDILVKVDRASMLNSLEVRAPFLDHRIVEFAFGKVPSRLKADGPSKKVILKKLAARLLPPQFDHQRKQGFSVPLASWLRTSPWRQFARDVLLAPGAFFNQRSVLALLKGQDRGRSNSERIFGLLMFELWRSEYNVTYSGAGSLEALSQ